MRNYSRAARPCSIWRRVGIQSAQMAISTLWIRFETLPHPPDISEVGFSGFSKAKERSFAFDEHQMSINALAGRAKSGGPARPRSSRLLPRAIP